MSAFARPYDHPAIEDLDEKAERRECRSCGVPVTGEGLTLRHEGEAVRMLIPAQADAPAVREAFEIALQAVRSRPGTAQLSPEDLMRIAIEAIYVKGALRTNRSTWERPAVCHAA